MAIFQWTKKTPQQKDLLLNEQDMDMSYDVYVVSLLQHLALSRPDTQQAPTQKR